MDNCQDIDEKYAAVVKWLKQVNYSDTRRLVLGLIRRINSNVLLQVLDCTLSPFAHKDLTYARSQFQSNITYKYLAPHPSCKTKGTDAYINSVWKWFVATSVRSQTCFVCGIINRVNDASVLNDVYNMVKAMLCHNERQHMYESHDNDDLGSIASTINSFHTDQHPELYLLANAKPLFWSPKMLEKKPEDLSDKNPRTSIHCFDPFHSMINRSWNTPCSMAKYKDFIAHLPIHLAKNILTMLDQKTLLNVKCVCKQWQQLTGQIMFEESTSQDIQEEAIMMQDICANVNLDKSSHSKVLNIAVPHCTTRQEKERIVTYHNAEEKDLFYGAYNVLVLSNEKDSKRVVHYSGGNLAACGFSNGAIRVLDIQTGQFLFTPTYFHPGAATALYISCEQNVVIYSGSYDTTIRCWHVGSSHCKQILYGHGDSLTCLDLADQLLVSGSKDGLIKVWDTVTAKCKCTFRHAKFSPVKCVAISENTIVSSCDKGTIKVWCLQSRKLRKILLGHRDAVNDLCLDKYFIISGSSDGYVLSWTKETNYKNTLISFRHPRGVLCVQLLYLRVVSGCVDGKIRVFNLLSGQCLRVIRGNSNCDPILSLHATQNRLLVNTIHTLLLMHFEEGSSENNFQKEFCTNNSKEEIVTLRKCDKLCCSSIEKANAVKAKPIRLPKRKSTMENVSRYPYQSNYLFNMMSLFSSFTPEGKKNSKESNETTIIKEKRKRPFSNERMKDGMLLRIRNLQHCTGSTVEDICTVINAAPADIRDMLQPERHQNTTDSWLLKKILFNKGN